MQHPRPRPRARGSCGKLLAGNFPLLAPASPKINLQRSVVIKRPRAPYPIFWKPDHRGPGFAHAGLGGARAVRLGTFAEVLMVGEGIETCLAVMQATGRPAWAALSTSGLRALDLPQQVREVVVLADGDEPGEAAARNCACRWKREGRSVRIARSPRGCDFNDLLLGRAPRIEESA